MYTFILVYSVISVVGCKVDSFENRIREIFQGANLLTALGELNE